jgi:protein involved in polysaccharide export with SLBB domain
MKNRSTTAWLPALLGLSLITMSSSSAAQEAQQPSKRESHSVSTGVKCLITVTGAVRAPSRLELRRRSGRLRLVEALAMTGGLTERAGKTVRITHAAPQDSECGESDQPYKRSEGLEVVNVADVMRGGEKANPYLLPGDVVDVTEAGVAYIVGSVAEPRVIILKEPITVTQAIEMAGGFTPGSKTDDIHLLRHPSADKTTWTDIRLDYKRIKSSRAEDILLGPFDVVDVRDKRPHGGGSPIFLDIPPPSPRIELPVHIVY